MDIFEASADVAPRNGFITRHRSLSWLQWAISLPAGTGYRSKKVFVFVLFGFFLVCFGKGGEWVREWYKK